MTGSYNNFFRIFDINSRKEVTLEASREGSLMKSMLKPRKVLLLIIINIKIINYYKY